MKIKIKIVIFLSITLSCFCHFAHATNTSIQQDIEIFKLGLETIHPGYKRYTTEKQRKAMWEHISTILNKDASLAQVYLEISRITSQIRCDHTLAEFPTPLEQQKKQRFMPFQFRIFDEKMYVDNAMDSLDLNKGDEILKINQITIKEIINKLSPLMPRDGYTDDTAISSIENNFNLLGSGFEQFFALEILKLDEFPKHYQIEYRPIHSDQIVTKTLNTITFKDWLSLYGGPYRLDFKDAIDLHFKDQYAIL